MKNNTINEKKPIEHIMSTFNTLFSSEFKKAIQYTIWLLFT